MTEPTRISLWNKALKACEKANVPYPPMDSEHHYCNGTSDDIWDWRHGEEGSIRWRISPSGDLKHLVVYATIVRWVGIGPKKKRECQYGPVSGQPRAKALNALVDKQNACLE